MTRIGSKPSDIARIGSSESDMPCMNLASTDYRDSGAKMGVSLDSRQVLKVFRYIGGFKGVEVTDLRDKVATIRNERVRTALLQDLDAIFSRHDVDKNGNLDVIEFERMVNSSTLLQTAVYEFLAKCGDDDFDSYQLDNNAVRSEYEELASLGIVLVHLFTASYALDHSPDWEGWQWIELVFLCLFSASLMANYHVHKTGVTPWFSFKRQLTDGLLRSYPENPWWLTDEERRSRRAMGSRTSSAMDDTETKPTTPPSVSTVYEAPPSVKKFYSFLKLPSNFIELVATISGWLEMCIFCWEKATSNNSNMEHLFWLLRRLRVIRFLRLLRLIQVIFYLRDVRAFLAGLVSGMRSAFCGFVSVAMLVFLWALFIRQSLVCGWVNDQEGIMKEVFPNTHKSMLVVVRCMVIGTDGSCMTGRNESVVVLLSKEFGYFFDLIWILTQGTILCGVFNVVAAIFVLQVHEHAQDIRDSIFCVRSAEDEVRLSSLDKLLRTLIYPNRVHFDPKAKHAAEVSQLIKKEHPEAAEKIPDLEEQVVEFARGIQDSKNMLQNAMNAYEAQEFEQCQMLQDTPSANLYAIDDKEILCVPVEEAGMPNPLAIPLAPYEAVEVLLLQESADLSDLLREGQEIQKYVKSLILPGSAWAMEQEAGAVEQIWKQSKGFCDVAVDPGLKSIERIRQKVSLKYGNNYRRNRDYCRLGLIYDSVDHLMQALPKFLGFQLDTDGIEVARIENRFSTPHQLGWRDITILLRGSVPSTGRKHIMEIQMQLRGLTECRGENHQIYEKIRAVLPDDVVDTILDRLVCDTTLDLGITKEEWKRCICNADVKRLLDGLGVPGTCRQRMFDLVDIDGSGTVTSSELQEILRLFRTPAASLELAGCHLRVKDVQRFTQTKLGPQLNKLHKMQKEPRKSNLCRHSADMVDCAHIPLDAPTHNHRKTVDFPNFASSPRSETSGIGRMEIINPTQPECPSHGFSSLSREIKL